MQHSHWIIQREIVGPKGQKNCLNLNQVFNIWGMINRRYLDFEELQIALETLNKCPKGKI